MSIYENGQCKRIELSFLLKTKQIQKGKVIQTNITWTNNRGKETGSISLIAAYTEKDKYLRLIYQSTHGRTKEVKEMDYMVQLIEVPSNLGKGKVLYMDCPSNKGHRCRILYCAYNTHKFYSREYYNNTGYRVYYPSQARSKRDYLYNRRLVYEKKFNEFWNEVREQSYYKGKYTKRFLKYTKVVNKFVYYTDRCNRMVLKRMERFR